MHSLRGFFASESEIFLTMAAKHGKGTTAPRAEMQTAARTVASEPPAKKGKQVRGTESARII